LADARLARTLRVSIVLFEDEQCVSVLVTNETNGVEDSAQKSCNLGELFDAWSYQTAVTVHVRPSACALGANAELTTNSPAARRVQAASLFRGLRKAALLRLGTLICAFMNMLLFCRRAIRFDPSVRGISADGRNEIDRAFLLSFTLLTSEAPVRRTPFV
jgi:hypothetical protein